MEMGNREERGVEGKKKKDKGRGAGLQDTNPREIQSMTVE